jgi:hypothetical protein
MLPSPAAQRVEDPVQALPPFAAAVVSVERSWPITVQVFVAAVLSTQFTGGGHEAEPWPWVQTVEDPVQALPPFAAAVVRV